MYRFVPGAVSLLAILLFTALQAANAAEPPVPPEHEVFFETKIRPLLAANCLECHGETKQQGGVRLDSRAALLADGDTGPVLVAGKPDESRLMEVISHTDSVKMPPKRKLSNDEIAALTEWVRMGAPFPAKSDAVVSLPPASPEGIAASREGHWSYQPIQKPNLPAVNNETLVRNEIDRFVLAKLDAAGLTLSPVADRRTLIRRLTFDITGLPPTTDETAAFLGDARPDALEHLVDRLLASPRYGERWGRHWLDVARYADTKGYVFTEERKYPFSYTYRDYVVAAFNSDKPFDQFVLEQLAADQLDLKGDLPALAGMGYLTLGRRFGNNANDIIDDRIDVVTRGLLGLTVGCARCHDHKYDPIPTADYYSLYGVFATSNEPADLPQIGAPQDNDAYRKYTADLETREKAVQDYKVSAHVNLINEARTRSADYLLAIVRNSEKDSDGRRRRGDDLKRSILTRWKNYLTDAAKAHHPVFAPWQQFAGLPVDQFAAKATELSLQIAQAPTGDEPNHINARVRAAFTETPPRSMDDVAGTYGRLLAAVHNEWQTVRKGANPPDKLSDAAAEELRQVLYAESAPPVISLDDAVNQFDRAARTKLRDLQKQVDTLKATSPAAPPRAMVLNDNQNPPPMSRIFIRGNPGRPGAEVPRRFLQVISPHESKFQQGSGRLELAQAIVSPDNPLTARVIVNRIWQQHFGAGLVRTASDFGARGEAPTHPELLDFLARGFMDDGWSLKKLHRRILLSATYLQQSLDRTEGRVADPENRLLWKMNRRRLEFEPLRDSLLAVTGDIDLTMGGRPVDLFSQPYSRRRTIYGFIDRQDLPGLLRVFDLASPDVSTAQRSQTTVPQQALYTMNSPFVIEQARKVVARPEIANQSELEARIGALYKLILDREPTPDEAALAVGFVSQPPLGAEDAAWAWGYGGVDEATGKVTRFTRFPTFANGRWAGGSDVPDKKIGWAFLSAQGGHPGNPEFAVIRRWHAPHAGVAKVEGLLSHGAKQGDGVRARVISSRLGTVGDWTVQDARKPTPLAAIEVQDGDTLDFVIDCRANENSDGFNWSPVVTLDGQRWNSAADFSGPAAPGLTSMEQFAQVLLMSNEFVFVD